MLVTGASVSYLRVEATVTAAAVARPDHPAIIFGERRWTYAVLRDEIERRAAILVAAGMDADNGVAISEPVTDDLAISFLAYCRVGVVFFTAVVKLPSGHPSTGDSHPDCVSPDHPRLVATAAHHIGSRAAAHATHVRPDPRAA
jgi:non-ribosomal peptide synthetase component E (peptide arylation enzyme)